MCVCVCVCVRQEERASSFLRCNGVSSKRVQQRKCSTGATNPAGAEKLVHATVGQRVEIAHEYERHAAESKAASSSRERERECVCVCFE